MGAATQGLSNGFGRPPSRKPRTWVLGMGGYDEADTRNLRRDRRFISGESTERALV